MSNCDACGKYVSPGAMDCAACGHMMPSNAGDSSDEKTGGNGALLLAYLFLMLAWLLIGGVASLAPRLSPAASSEIADLAFLVWIALPITLAAVVFWPSGVTAVGALGHGIAWFWVVASLWQSLP